MLGILREVNLKEKDKIIETVTETYPYPISFRASITNEAVQLTRN